MTDYVGTCRPDMYTIVYKIKFVLLADYGIYLYNTSGWES